MSLGGQNSWMMFTAGDLSNDNIETTWSWHWDVVWPLSAPTNSKNSLWRCLQLRVNSQLAEFVLAPDKHFCVLDDSRWAFLLWRHLWRFALSMRCNHGLFSCGASVHHHLTIFALLSRRRIRSGSQVSLISIFKTVLRRQNLSSILHCHVRLIQLWLIVRGEPLAREMGLRGG